MPAAAPHCVSSDFVSGQDSPSFNKLCGVVAFVAVRVIHECVDGLHGVVNGRQAPAKTVEAVV